jgi:UDP-galactopyranose mutase
MKNIITPGLPPEYTDLLIQRLEKTAMDVTNLKSDLVAIIRAQMYEACARGYVVDQGSIHLDSLEHVHRLNIKQLLPERKVRNNDTLAGGSTSQ